MGLKPLSGVLPQVLLCCGVYQPRISVQLSLRILQLREPCASEIEDGCVVFGRALVGP